MRAVASDPHAAHALPSHPTGLLQGHEGAVLCVSFNASGTYALTGGMVKVFSSFEFVCSTRTNEREKKLDLLSLPLTFTHHH